MKKILIMIILFISFFFINNINAKAYWKYPVGWEAMGGILHSINEGYCQGPIMKNLKPITYKYVNVDNNADVCYAEPKLENKMDKKLDICIFPTYFDQPENYESIKNKDGVNVGCPDGYFYIEYIESPYPGVEKIFQYFGPHYRDLCIPCDNYDRFVGSKKSNNGKSCYITGKKVEVAPGIECRNNYNADTLACGKDGEGTFIIEGNTGFDNTIKYLGGKIEGYNEGDKICPEGYLFSLDGYCYECASGDEPGGNPENIKCDAFKEITTPIWNAIRIIAPILAIVLGALDFLKATAASDEKEMQKATSSFVKRLIMLALLFLLTYIINFIVGLIGFGGLDACL